MIPTYRPCTDEREVEAIREVLRSGWLGMGAVTERFEQRVAEFIGVRHVVAVNSGTAALHLGLECAGIGKGDEVIVPSFTFPGSIQAIVLCGATPVFAEIQADDLTIDTAHLEELVTPRTRAVMPVHFGGTACDMDRIHCFAAGHDLRIVEDAAHAFGSTYGKRRIGSFGDVACFSFDPIKNITCGGGGALATSNRQLAEQARIKRELGINRSSWRRNLDAHNRRYDVVTSGYRYHMSDINAAIGIVQLDRFDEFRARKAAIARQYDAAFADVRGLRIVQRDLGEAFAFGYFVRIMEGRRDALAEHLADSGIATRVQFTPSHLHSAFGGESANLPITEQVYSEILTLPLYCQMTQDDVGAIIATVLRFFRSGPEIAERPTGEARRRRRITPDTISSEQRG